MTNRPPPQILTKVIKKVKGVLELFPQNIIFYVLEPYSLYPRMDRVRHFEVSSGHLSYCLSEKPLISFNGTNLINNHVFLAYNFKHFFFFVKLHILKKPFYCLLLPILNINLVKHN